MAYEWLQGLFRKNCSIMKYSIIEIIADFGITHKGSIQFDKVSGQYFIKYSSIWSDNIPDMIIADKSNLSDYDQIAACYKNHLSQYIYLEGIISLLQLSGRYEKKEMATVYKVAKISRSNSDCMLDEVKIKAKIFKRFNIKSEWSLSETIQLVNTIGFQERPVTFLRNKIHKESKSMRFVSHSNLKYIHA